MYSVLDNPIWNALNTLENDKNVGTKELSFFDAEMAPFIGMQIWDKKNQLLLLENVPDERSWFLLIIDEVDFIDELEVVFSLPLYQFTCSKLNEEPMLKNDVTIVQLDDNHIDEMIALTQLTKPGPFTKRTIEFGGYHGIFENGKLVAMGGERLHVDGFTEVSAICTHPNHQGKGYAAKITRFLTTSVLNKGSIPFLHARTDNVNAIKLYERLGYEIRAKIQFYIIKKRA